MIQSMTGYGRGSAGRGVDKVTALIRAVNGRFLDIKIRGIDIDPADEKKVRNLITDSLIRGTIHVNLELDGGGKSQSLKFNEERYEVIEGILLEVQKKYGRHLDMGDIINSNDLFTLVDNDGFSTRELINAVEQACGQVVEMRTSEGEKLKDDFLGRLNILTEVLNKITLGLPQELKKRAMKYKNQITELLDNATIDESRVAQEVAMLAEKADVTEEVVRLKSHFEQFSEMLLDEKPAGRRLNFLLQEMSREINTIGSKSSSENIINQVIIMKDEAEKMREQVQNIL